MKTTNDEWDKIKSEINEELEKFNKRVTLEERCKELCKEYHKTRSIDAACRLADTLYDLLYN